MTARRPARAVLALFAAALAAPEGQAAPPAPTVARIAPAALVPGAAIQVEFFGEGLEGAAAIWTSFPCRWKKSAPPAASGAAAAFEIELDSAAAPAIGALRLVTPQGVSTTALIAFDRLPSRRAAAANRDRETAFELDGGDGALDCAVEGAIEGGGSGAPAAWFGFAGRAGQRFAIEVLARRLGSALDPFVRVLEPGGRELLAVDDSPGLLGDILAVIELASEGRHLIELRDSEYESGPQRRYRLRLLGAAAGGEPAPLWFAPPRQPGDGVEAMAEVHAAEPNDVPPQATAAVLPAVLGGGFERRGDRDLWRLEVEAGLRLELRAASRSLGAPADLRLRLLSLDGSQIAASDPQGDDEGTLEHLFKEPGACLVQVEELNRQGGPRCFYRIAARAEPPAFSLALAEDGALVAPGGAFELPVKAKRRGFDGPIAITVEGLDDPSAWRLEAALIEKGKDATMLKLVAPPALLPGSALLLRLVGAAGAGARPLRRLALTREALRPQFPFLAAPPAFLDGVFILGVGAAP